MTKEQSIVEGKFVKKLDDIQLHCRALFLTNSMDLVSFRISCYPKNNIHKWAPMKIHQPEEHLYEIIGECKIEAQKRKEFLAKDREKRKARGEM